MWAALSLALVLHAAETPIEGLEYQLGSRVYMLETATREGPAGLNPENRTAELPWIRGAVLANLDVNFEWSAIKASVKPRALLDSSWLHIEQDRYTTVTGELYLQEAILSLEESGFRVSGGRYYYDHGPSVFFSPSNPFTFG